LIDSQLYAELLRIGFRRSGNFVYRPHCDSCSACVPLRVIVGRFKATRAQHRAWKKHHSELSVRFVPLELRDEHYALYRRYQRLRHQGGGMDRDSREQYEHFLVQSHVDTLLVEFRDREEHLAMISLIDVIGDGLSAVYTFYDPDLSGSLGTFSVLWQVELARTYRLPYVYLGYWIAESEKMAYKAKFSPCEILTTSGWSGR